MSTRPITNPSSTIAHPSINVIHSSLQLTSAVQVTNIANSLDSRQPRKIEQEFAGLWKIVFELPSSRSKPAESHLRIYVAPSLNPNVDYSHLGVVTVSLSLESLGSGEVQTKHSYEWDVSHDAALVEEKWVKLMIWSTLWADNPETQRDDGFRVVVGLSSVPPPIRPLVKNPLLLNNMLELMEGQDIIDTKFLAFSRRREDNDVVGAYRPLPVYANSQLLRSQGEHFDHLLGNDTFTESQLEDFDSLPKHLSIVKYDDDTDSDLGYFSGEEVEIDEAEDEDPFETEPVSAHSVRSSSRPRSSWTNLSDDSLPTIDQLGGQDLESTFVDNNSEEELWSSSRLHRKHCRHHNRFGKVINIPDFAYVTWKALIFYLNTSQISFAPLTVSRIPRSRSASERSQGLPSRPSAKSIYRAADKLGLNDLTALALNHIKSQLTKEVVISELFSKFTSRFVPVRDVEVQFVFDNWDDLKTSTELERMIGKVVSGDMPHADKVLAILFARSP